VVLPFRPGKSTKAYQKIWDADKGSPLTFFTRQLSAELAAQLAERDITVTYAMRYGEPSIASQLRVLKEQGIEEVLVLPLYPQYSSTTTASIYDDLVKELDQWRHLPSFRFISDYHQHPAYIAAVADSIRQAWREQPKNALLVMSFHGLPEQLTKWGDPYFHHCHKTAALLAEQLGLSEQDWKIVFQSRFGKAEWLKPYCVDTLQALPGLGVTTADMVCPGFAVDCLETLEEIAMENRAIFMEAGGEAYRYIGCLNDSAAHAQALLAVLDL
jgi:ferrochelatase